jgi:hypothetical protein
MAKPVISMDVQFWTITVSIGGEIRVRTRILTYLPLASTKFIFSFGP